VVAKAAAKDEAVNAAAMVRAVAHDRERRREIQSDEQNPAWR